MAKFLTRCSPVTHVCLSKLTTIGPDNDLSPGRRQAIIWTDAVWLVSATIAAICQ